MGKGLEFKCKKCGFSIGANFGIGFFYPRVCEEILENIRQGIFGDEMKNAANTIPNVAVHQKNALFVCDCCGALVVNDVVDLCAPTRQYKKRTVRFSSAFDFPDARYVMNSDIGDTYRIIYSVKHKCDRCGNQMRVLKDEEMLDENLTCPECKEKLTISGVFCWD